jgi:hypothetical protein
VTGLSTWPVVEQPGLSRAELIRRADRVSRERYGTSFSEAQLADFIKDGLVEPAERIANSGLAPIYRYGTQSYRRVLQLVRMRSAGVVRRDAIALQLFTRGYGVTAELVREALWREHRQAIRKALGPVRTRYLDNAKAVPPKRLRSLEQSIGPLDDAFDAAGLRLPTETYLELVRNAKRGLLDTAPASIDFARLVVKLDSVGLWTWLVEEFSAVLAGLMQVDRASPDRSSAVDYVEKLLSLASNSDLEVARHLLVSLVTGLRQAEPLMDALGVPIPLDLGIALNKVAWSALHQDWVPPLLVLGTLFQRKFGLSFSTPDFPYLRQEIRHRRFTITDLGSMVKG